MPDNQNLEQPAATQQIINNAGAYKITIPYFNPDKYQNKENGWISATTWIRQVEQAVKAAGKKADGSPKNCSSMDSQAFEKFENAVFFKIFKIPSNRQLILV